MLAPLEQSGWAVGMGVNFLGSGYHKPAIGAMGSGIYSSKGPLNFTYYEGSGSEIVTARIPKIKRRDTPDDAYNRKNVNKKGYREQKDEIEANLNNKKEMSLTLKNHQIIYEDLSIYARVEMTKGHPEMTTLCYNKTFCCHASYNISDTKPSTTYQLLAYKGARLVAGVYTLDVAVCGLVLCQGGMCGVELDNGDEQEVFQRLELEAIYSKTTKVLPSILNWSGILPDWEKIQMVEWEWGQGKKVILFLEESSLYSAALYGRTFDLKVAVYLHYFFSPSKRMLPKKPP